MEIVAPPSDQYENYVVQLKEQSLLKKKRSRPKQKNKHHIFAPTVHCTIFSKFCMVIELVMPIKKGGFIFRSNS